MQHTRNESAVSLGVLGRYVIDSTECFGLFIRLNEYIAFVDIKEDNFVEQRKVKALNFYENQQLLSEKLCAFLELNSELLGRRVQYIGLHSTNLEQSEIFWDPNGYTLLEGFEFR